MRFSDLFRWRHILLVVVTLSLLVGLVSPAQAVYAPATCRFPLDHDVVLYEATGPEYALSAGASEPYPATNDNSEGNFLWVVGRTPDGEYWIVEKLQRTVRTQEPQLFLLPIGDVDTEVVANQIVAFSETRVAGANCDPPQWGVPDIPSVNLNTLVTDETIGAQYDLPISAWHAEGYRGQGVRVGVIDAGFTNYEAVSNEDSVQLLSPNTGEGFHGTYVLAILADVAPDAEYFLAVASQDVDEFERAVGELVALEPSIDIIVHAANAYTLAPDGYYEAALAATDAGILWINAAGNIGAGYYFDDYRGTPAHQFDDRNRGNPSENTLMVPVDVTHNVTVRVVWDGVPTRDVTVEGQPDPVQVPVNDFELRVQNLFAPFASDYYDPDVLQAPNEQEVREGNWQDRVYPPTEILAIPSDVLRGNLSSTVRIPIYDGDEEGVPETYGECTQQDNCGTDAYDDNEIYIGLTTSPRRGGFTQRGTAFEIFVEGAIPAEYDITINPGLEPVVPVPGDLAEVLTVGAYNPDTNRLTWYSGRSNVGQYVLGWPREGDQAGSVITPERVVKPDVATLGTLIIQRPDGSTYTFSGTSASTPLLGGVAALLYSHSEIPEFVNRAEEEGAAAVAASTARNILTDQAIACLDDGAVGQRVPRLVLPLPGEINNLARITCSSNDYTRNYNPEVTEPRSFERAGGVYNPLRATLDEIENADRASRYVNIQGAASGSGTIGDETYTATHYVLEVRRENIEPESWLLLEAIGVGNTLPVPGGPDDSPCRYTSSAPEFAHGPDPSFFFNFNTTLFYNDQIDPYDYGAGEYIVRLTLCQDEQRIPGMSDTQRFTLAEITPVAEFEPPDSWGETVEFDRDGEALPTLAGTINVRGQAEGGAWAGYVFQVRPIGDNRQPVDGGNWYPVSIDDDSLVGTVVDDQPLVGTADDGDSPPDLCGESVMRMHEVRAGGTLAQLDTTAWQFAEGGDYSGDGFYELALTHCQGDTAETPSPQPYRETILINNYTLPFADIVQPEGDVSGLVDISGHVGGEQFTRYLLTITPADSDLTDWAVRMVRPGDQTFTSQEDWANHRDALCAESASDISTVERPAPPSPDDDLGQFTAEEAGFPAGDYELHLYRCADYSLDGETEDTAIINISYPEHPILTINPGQQLSGEVAQLTGQVYVPDPDNFAYYVVEIAPAGEVDPDAWEMIAPHELPNSATYCDNVVDDPNMPLDETLGCKPQLTGPLAELNTWNYESGNYQARLSLYLDDGQGNAELWIPPDDVPSQTVMAFTIDNPTIVAVTTPPDNTVLSPQQFVLGQIRAAILEGYTLSLHLQPNDVETPDDAEATNWPPPDEVDTWVAYYTYQGTEPITVVDTNSDLIGGGQHLDTTVLPSGTYYLLIELNTASGQSETHRFGPYTIDHSPQLTVVDPPPSSDRYPVVGSLVIRGLALGGDSYRGYVISTAGEQERLGQAEEWTVQYPPLDEPLYVPNTSDVGDALCQAVHERLLAGDGLGLDMEQAGAIDGPDTILASLPLNNIPAGHHVLRVDLCTLAEGEPNDPATWRLEAAVPPRSRYLDVTNPEFTVGLTAEIVTGERVNFVGTITAPDFAQYIIEVAPVQPVAPDGNDQSSLVDAYHWELVAGPADVDPTGGNDSAVVDPAIYCDTAITEGNFGYAPVEMLGPLGAYTVENVRYNHHVRVTVCRTDHAPYIEYFFDVIPATGGPSDGATWQATAIASPYVAVRSGPGRDFPLIGQLNFGESSNQILGRNETGYWVQVELSDGTVGWVSTSVVSVVGSGSVLDLPLAEDIPFLAIPDDVFLVMEIDGVRDIYRSDMNGSEPQRITTLGTVETLSISPRGNTLLFDAIVADGTIQIFRVQVDGSSLMQLTSGPGNNIMPSWANDGRQIIFSSDRQGNYDLYIMDALGNNVQPLVAEPSVEEYNGEAEP